MAGLPTIKKFILQYIHSLELKQRFGWSIQGQVVLAGEIKKDTVLSGVYIVKDTFTIPKSLSLTIEPETRIMFDENASLAVFGKIVVNGKDRKVI